MMNEIFLLLVLLFVKHFVVDFIFQTHKQVIEKGIYGAQGGIEHSGQHAIATFFILLLFISWPGAVILATIDGLLHYHIDWTKININKRKNLTTNDKEFWVWLGADQLAHTLTYLWICWILT